MDCDWDKYERKLNQMLNKSLIPRPCQECQLSSTGCTRAESIEWILDLKRKLPLWSRLNDINTQGYKRKLPMAMTKNYDIEINRRLWSLWGTKRKHTMNKIFKTSSHKFYMAATVVALCAARAISLNVWTTRLMDCIVENARLYFKNSLAMHAGLKKNNFKLEHLASAVDLEGICFKVNLKQVLEGRLYSVPLESRPNLAFSLIHFFKLYQFGILQCCQRILGIGFIDGPSGGYFMYDAQSINKPLFRRGYCAPYILRTNHLQVLLYCLVITLNIPVLYADFNLHRLDIKIQELEMPKPKPKRQHKCQRNFSKCRILGDECWKVPSAVPSCPTSQVNVFEEIQKCKDLVKVDPRPVKPKRMQKYARKRHNICKEDEKGIIKPTVDHDQWVEEGMTLNKDFVRMVCSGTKVPRMPEEEAEIIGKDFARNLTEIMLMKPKICIDFGEKF